MGKNSVSTLYRGGVVNYVSEYKKTWMMHTTGSELPQEEESVLIDKLLREYHDDKTTEKRRLELKHDILMHIYFIFPYYLKKHYWFTSEMFNDAMQNMAANTLRAIETFDPSLGYKFSNYLIGYFRDAATTALKSVNVVPVAALRQAAIDASLPEDEEDAESPYIVRNSEDQDLEEETRGLADDGENREDPDLEEGNGNVADDGEKENIWEENIWQNSGTDDEENWFAANEYDNAGNRQRVLRGASQVRGNVVELDDSRLYPLAPGTEKENDIDEKIHQNQLKEWLEDAISAKDGLLTEEERFILVHHFGLFNNPPMKYSEISKIRKQKGTGYSCSRISQINTSAIKKLREFFLANDVEL